MWNVVGSLVPIVAAATYYFGPSTLLVIAAATAGAMVTEALFGPPDALSRMDRLLSRASCLA